MRGKWNLLTLVRPRSAAPRRTMLLSPVSLSPVSLSRVLIGSMMIGVLFGSGSGCASRRPPIEPSAERAADDKPRGETFGQKMRDKGTDTLPFWYSDKSKDIARNLGSGD